jgi:hypothetical protein
MPPIDLLPHQAHTLEFLERKCSNQHGLLVYHNMGTGKTNTGVAWLLHRQSLHEQSASKEPFRHLIVCPELIKSRWHMEAEQMGFYLTPSHICNYEEFTHRYISDSTSSADALSRTTIVMDEAHHLAPLMRKNKYEHYSKFMNVFSERHTASGQRVMLLTGTPEYSDRSDFSLLLNVASGASKFPINERDWYTRYQDTRKVKAMSMSWVFNFGKPLLALLLRWILGWAYVIYMALIVTVAPNPKFNMLFANLMGISMQRLQVMTLQEFARLKKIYVGKCLAVCMAFFTSALMLLNYIKVQHSPSLALRATPVDYKKLAQDTGRYVSFYHNSPDNPDYAAVQTTPPIFSQYTDYQSKQSMQFLFGTMDVEMVKFYTGITDEHEVNIRVEEFRTIDALKRYGRCISNTWDVVDKVVDGTAKWNHCPDTGSIDLVPSDADGAGFAFHRSVKSGCPKFKKLCRLLSSSLSRNEKCVVRSDFKEQGTYLLSAYLNANSIDHIYVNTTLTGPARQKLLEAFNKGTQVTSSMTGKTQRPRILLLDAEASEGISLMAVEHMHLLEPMMHVSQQNQCVARAVRYRSHQALPKKHRSVAVYTHVGTLDTKHLDYKGLATVLNTVPMGMSKLLRDPQEQATNYKMSLLHWRNIESHLSKHFAGIVPRTGFKLIDYFINPTRYLDARYTRTTTADTLVMEDLQYMYSAHSSYMAHAVSENVLAEAFQTPQDCVPSSAVTIRTTGFRQQKGRSRSAVRQRKSGGSLKRKRCVSRWRRSRRI